VYDRRLCGELAAFVGERERAVPALAPGSEGAKLLPRIRNALCWLVSPYL